MTGMPSAWGEVSMKRLLSFGNGRDHKHIQVDESGYPVYGSGAIFAYASDYLYDGESVLFGRKGTVDKPLYVNERFWTVDTMYYTRIGKIAEPRFLYYAALIIPFDMYSTNTALPSITQETLGKHKVRCPPLDEQKQIASFLDYETAKIDALIEKQQQLIALLGEKRQAVISHTVTKGLNPDAPMRDSGVEWIGSIPDHWRTPPVYARYDAVLGKMFDENKLTGRHPIVYLRNADVNWDSINVESLPTINIAPHEFARFTVKKGDLLICEGGAGIGQTAIWQGELEKCAFQKALHRLRPLDSTVENPRFFYYCMRFLIETGYVLAGGTATIPHLTGEQLRKYRFPCPPKHEQDDNVKQLDTLSERFDKIEIHAAEAMDLLRERRTALISAAVTGKIDVRGWKRPSADRTLETEMEVA